MWYQRGPANYVKILSWYEGQNSLTLCPRIYENTSLIMKCDNNSQLITLRESSMNISLIPDEPSVRSDYTKYMTGITSYGEVTNSILRNI